MVFLNYKKQAKSNSDHRLDIIKHTEPNYIIVVLLQ